MIEFFDANVVVGRPQNGSVFEIVPDGPALCSHLDEKGIARALLMHWGQAECNPLVSNALVDEAVAASERLFGCWAVLPPLTDPMITNDFFPRMKQARAAALCLMPKAHRYVLDPIVWRGFMDEVCERRIPVVLTMGQQVEWDALYRFLREMPTLTCILRNIGIWSMDRYTYPLLDAYENVHVETSMLAVEDGGVEEMAKTFGAERVLFGTGFPAQYVEAAMLQLVHADLAEAARTAIASGNLERLIAGADYE